MHPISLLIVAASVDRAQVGQIERALQVSYGTAVRFWHSGSLEPGAHVQQTLDGYLREADAAVFLLSPELFSEPDSAKLAAQARLRFAGTQRLVAVQVRPTVLDALGSQPYARILLSERALSEHRPQSRGWRTVTHELTNWLAAEFPDRSPFSAALREWERDYRKCLGKALQGWPYFVEPRLLAASPRMAPVESAQTTEVSIEPSPRGVGPAELISQEPLTLLLGTNASGKTCALSALARTTAATGQIHSAVEAAAENTPPTWQDLPSPVFPVLVHLGRCNGKPKRQGVLSSEPLLELAGQYTADWLPVPRDRLERLFMNAWQQGRLLLLFDGLNEMDEDARQALLQHLRQTLSRSQQVTRNRIVLTSQPGLPDLKSIPSAFCAAFLQSLAPPDVKRFLLTAASRTPSPDAGSQAAQARVATLLSQLQEDPQGMDMASNPQLLAMLFSVHTETETVLRAHRGELFDRYVDQRLRRCAEGRKNGPEQVEQLALLMRRHLAELALRLLQAGQQGAVRRRALRDELATILGEARRAVPAGSHKTVNSEAAADKILTDLIRRSGLVIEHDQNSLRFMHTSVQAFFAAMALAALPAEQRNAVLIQQCGNPYWGETIAFCVSLLNRGLRSGAADALVDALWAAAASTEAERQQRLHLVAACLLELGHAQGETAAQVVIALGEQLQSRVPQLRTSAIEALSLLAGSGCPDAERFLCAQLELKRPEADVIAAARRLAEREPHGHLSLRLRALIAHPDPQVQQAAINALRWSLARDPQLLDVIARKLEDPEDAVQRATFDALMPLWEDNASLRALLRDKLRSENPRTQQAAVLAVSLEQQENPELLELLCDLCKQAPMLVRYLAASKLSVKAASNAKIRSLVFSVLDQIPPLLANTLLVSLMMLSRFSPALRDDVLQRIDGDWPVFGVELPPDMQSFSLFLLRYLDAADPQIFPVLLRKLRHPRPEVRIEIARSLAQAVLRNPTIVEGLWQLVADDDEQPEVRAAALSTLLPIVPSRADWWDVIKRRMAGAHISAAAMIEAQAELVRFDRKIRCQLRDRLTQETDEACRRALIKTLWSHRSERKQLLDLALEELAHADSENVLVALSLLAPFLPLKCLRYPRLQRCFSHSDPRVRRSALRWLESLPEAEERTAQLWSQLEQETDDAAFLHAWQLLGLLQNTDVALYVRAAKALLRFTSQQIWASPLQLLALLMAPLLHASDPAALLQQLAEVQPSWSRWLEQQLAQARALLADRSSLPQWAQVQMQTAPLGDSLQFFFGHALSREAHRAPVDLAPFLEQLTASPRTQLHHGALGILVGASPEQRSRGIARLLTQPDLAPEQVDGMLLLHSLSTGDPHQARLNFEKLTSSKTESIRWASLHGLLPHIAQDAALALRFTPWLGLLSSKWFEFVAAHDRSIPKGLASSAALRRALAEAISTHLPHEQAIYDALLALLDSPRWQARQGAAWALSLMKSRPPASLRVRLRGLLLDQRTDEDWLERLQTARSMAAIWRRSDGSSACRASFNELYALADGALQYGREPWEMNLGQAEQVRSCAIQLLAELPDTSRSIATLRKISDEDPGDRLRDQAYRQLQSLQRAQAQTVVPPRSQAARSVL